MDFSSPAADPPPVLKAEEGESSEAAPMASANDRLFRGLKKARRERGCTAKERISKMPPCAAGKRSSIYRGVTRHRWTGRYEAHLWDKSTWNQNQNKKGKQGAYDDEEAAARAYDLAALKYWGPGTLINFPVSDYSRDLEEMRMVSREDYLASLRRKSSGFSRGFSKYRGISRPSQSSRWDTSLGRMLGNEYFNSIHCSTSEDAATESEYATGFCLERKIDLTNYIRWWGHNKIRRAETATKSSEESHGISEYVGGELKTLEWPIQHTEPYQLPSLGLPRKGPVRASACSILSQSAAFKNLQVKTSETQDGRQKNKIGYEKAVPKLITIGGREKSGVASGLSDLPLQRTYPLNPLLSAPSLTNCSTIDPLPDPTFWSSLIPPTGLSLTTTLRKTEMSSTHTFYLPE
ncbi:AP2-like ethylene-responsive transcription factor At2g41710 [Magnolia sinica]|uniref:AP2-like ethylene-responsive transcription factor At2g41710 n=1 Tax=Magnolia sinica TaxID=86752 RepID=UPI002657FBF9|nr:AP2-like ethylene-responsive transcription factor At2g41710 [Magnolia sinica]